MNKKDYEYALILDKYYEEEKDLESQSNPLVKDAILYFQERQ